MLWLKELTCIGKVRLKRSTGLVLLLCREAMRHGEPRVHFVAMNSKDMHSVKGSMNDLKCDSSEAFFSVKIITNSPYLAYPREILRTT